MWKTIVIIAMCLFGRSAAIQDLSNLCVGHRNGDVVANPYDCQSYFVCNIVPKLRFCDEGLYFDAKLKLCNWPEYANCPISRPQAPTSGDTQDSLDFGWFAPKPRPSFIAIDVDTGLQTDPLTKYNPKHVECRHFGAYFLPHPRACQRYFLCAYGHLHQHYCGRGTMWNYKKSVCELASVAECYENTTTVEQYFDDDDAHVALTDVSMTTAALPTTSAPPNPATVCFVVDIAYTQPPTTQATTTTTIRDSTTTTNTYISHYPPFYTTSRPSSTTTNTHITHDPPFSTTPRPSSTTTNTYITHDPTFSTTPRPSSTTTNTYITHDPTFSTTPRPTMVPVTSTARADTNILECPKNREAYLPHKRDCSKYFICIVGMPVLTSCPDGLYWNQNAEFCDAPKNVDCQM